MKRVLVTGAAGFIGSHLVKHLRKKGYWVRGVDIKASQYSNSQANEFLILDLRRFENCLAATLDVKEVYTLAADMGGMGFISKEHISSFTNSDLVNLYMAEASRINGVKRLFFSSSACVYPNHLQTSSPSVLTEDMIIPAEPNEAYGWEKLFAELRYQAYQKHYEVRIARFENCYGPECTYEGGREKAPAAISRKVIQARDHVEIWGDGKATRSYVYVDDLVEGIFRLMRSDYQFPVNLGSDESVTVEELTNMIIKISGKDLKIKYVDGPEGVKKRIVDHSVAKRELDWEPTTKLEDGLKITYDWIKQKYG